MINDSHNDQIDFCFVFSQTLTQNPLFCQHMAAEDSLISFIKLSRKLLACDQQQLITFIQNIIERVVDFEDLIMNDDNYKDILLRYFQHHFKITPKYIQLESNGPSNNREFIMGVLDKDGNIIGKGIEKSKKKAEQEASRQALIYYEELEA